MNEPKTGRKKFSQRRKNQFVKLLAEGLRRTAAAEQVGVAYSTIHRNLMRDETFAAAVDDAEMHIDDQVVDALFEAATSGNVPAATYWLNNRRPQEWGDRKKVEAEHSGPGGGPISIQVIWEDPEAGTVDLEHDDPFND